MDAIDVHPFIDGMGIQNSRPETDALHVGIDFGKH